MRILYAPGCEDLQLEQCTRQSALKAAQQSLLHCWHQYYSPNRTNDSSPAQALGTLTHCLTLEPGEFASRYIVAPTASRTSTDGCDALIEFYTATCEDRFLETPEFLGGKLADKRSYISALEALLTGAGFSLVSQSDLDAATQMHANLWKIPGIAAVLSHPLCQTEVTILWRDPETGLSCRVTLDIMVPPCPAFPCGIILDLKTTKDASFDAFRRDIEKYNYHWQADYYRRGFTALYGTVPPYGWAAVENTEPYLAAFYECEEDFMTIARREYLPLLVAISRAMETGVWPGYPIEPQKMGPSKWLARKHNMEGMNDE